MSDASVVTFMVVSMIIILIITVSVMWFFYHSQNKIIQLNMKKQASLIEYQKNLLINTVKTQENERNRIAAELHDDVASKLNVIHLNVHLLKTKWGFHPEQTVIIDQIETSLNESIRRTRMISHELMPPLLKKFGFHYTLHELVQSVNATGVISVLIEDIHHCQIKDDHRQLHLFRIIQELISNTLKYAQATKIEISFSGSQNEEDIVLNYKDDGVGFDTNEVTSGLGFYNIKTRTELLQGDGRFVHRNDGTGIHYVLKFPKDV
ncbi:MAG: hypothetical protein IPN79_15060 [Saprospiraceae bacterium]|nr:hypothetical protein [Saprospiraceae bacterium]